MGQVPLQRDLRMVTGANGPSASHFGHSYLGGSRAARLVHTFGAHAVDIKQTDGAIKMRKNIIPQVS